MTQAWRIAGSSPNGKRRRVHAEGAAEQLVTTVGQRGRAVFNQGDEDRDGGTVVAGQQTLRGAEPHVRVGIDEKGLHVGALFGRSGAAHHDPRGGAAGGVFVLEGGKQPGVHLAVVDAQDRQAGQHFFLDIAVLGVRREGQQDRGGVGGSALADQPRRGRATAPPAYPALRPTRSDLPPRSAIS